MAQLLFYVLLARLLTPRVCGAPDRLSSQADIGASAIGKWKAMSCIGINYCNGCCPRRLAALFAGLLWRPRLGREIDMQFRHGLGSHDGIQHLPAHREAGASARSIG
jgi:hypothetical protein